MKTATTLSLALGSALFLASTASAQTTLFEDDFNGLGTDVLFGTTPDTTTGGATWKVDNNTQFAADGTITSPGSEGAYLDYTPVVGNLYELKADITVTGGGGNWITFGWTRFTNPDQTGNPLFASRFTENGGIAVGLLTSAGLGKIYDGLGANNESYNDGAGGTTTMGDGSNSQTFEILLDLRDSGNFTYTFTVGGTTHVTDRTISASRVGLISGFGVSSNNTNGSIDNLSLAIIPEPSAFALFAGLGAFLLVARRRRMRD